MWLLVSSAASLAQVFSGLLHAVCQAVASPCGKLSSNWEVYIHVLHCGVRIDLCKFMVQVRVVTSRLHVYAVSKICPDRKPILSSFQSPKKCIPVTNVNMKVINVKLSLSTTSRHRRGMQVQFHSLLTSELDGGE